ncbi:MULTISPECIES: TonB-dependent receptor [unclassified Iodidimonas]|uniref:TonB-dependent receptor plug domain-containing protein n=1 Tax=unclassified Iodidimonas TaxID=2626145 RepID=UPI002482C18D|nr:MULTISPECIES: TonB-dependent receptor [unclassified Iodidimonas]
MKNKMLRTLLMGSSGGFALLLTMPALAQPDQSQTDEKATTIEEVVVTGSRIRRNPLNSPSPIVNLSSEDIDRSGLTNVGDFLQRLPQSQGTFNSRFNNSGNFGFPPDGGGIGAGSVQADLRGLGPKRVLVLVDGKRWVNETSGSGVSSAVDLGTVPTNAIERIEVLQDGASAIYGSDAIAGVINIITKKDFEGFKASAYGGMFLNEGDGETQEYSLSFGSQGERTRIFVDVTYNEASAIRASDRKISAFPTPGVGACTPFCSSGTPQGRFIFGTGAFDGDGNPINADITLNNGAINQLGNLAAFDPANPASLDFNAFDTSDRFNFAQFNLVSTPNKRVSVFSNIEHDLTDNVVFEMKAVFNNRESTNQAAPEPLFIGPDAGNGNLMDTISVDATNPFNPFGITLNADNGFVFAGRRPLEAGPRIFEQNVDTWYLNGGLRGDFTFEDRSFFWDINATFSESRGSQRKFGAFNSAKLKQALGPIDQCLNPDGSSINGCVPFNFFGGQGADGTGSITPEMLDFVTFVQKDESESELFDVTANISGDLIRLPAGWIAFAGGYEHRKREGFFQPDAVVVAGESAGVPSTPTQGSFNVDEVYGEIVLPLLAGVPFAEYLEASFAARYSDFSTFGGNTTIKAGVNWRITEDFLLRGSYAEGLRAPGIGELFGSEARFDATLQDPCSNFLGLGGGNPASAQIQANCVALGVPADGSFTQLNSQISTTVGGNRELQPETSDSFSISSVYSPKWAADIKGVESLTFEATYWNIDLENAIQAIDQDVKLQGCVQTLDPVLCSGISRTPGGAINGFNIQLQNIGGIETDGVDFSIDYQSPMTDFGRFSAGVLTTWVNSFEESFPSADGFTRVERVGTEQGDPEKGWPEFRVQANLNWAYKTVSVNFIARYIDGLTESCPANLFGVSAGGINDLSTLCSDPADGTNKLSSKIYGDLQATWQPAIFEDRIAFSVGINNILQTDPPECFSCALNGFDATLFDVPGRFGYAQVNVTF